MKQIDKLSAAGSKVFSETWKVVRHYEQHFGSVPDWVADDLNLSQQIALLASANHLHMRLADHDMVVGEYL
jgi:hypothetical protein